MEKKHFLRAFNINRFTEIFVKERVRLTSGKRVNYEVHSKIENSHCTDETEIQKNNTFDGTVSNTTNNVHFEFDGYGYFQLR